MSTVAEVKPFESLTADKWKDLLTKIQRKKCTPIIGPEVPFGTLAGRDQLVEAWGNQLGFPFEDLYHLPRVAQFAATQTNPADARDAYIERLGETTLYDPDSAEDPHRILASLPFPLYLTTNHDSSLYQALKQRKDRQPRQKVCPWIPDLDESATELSAESKLEVATPVVYHLFGHTEEPRSLVLTEDDHLNFLMSYAADRQIVPSLVGKELTKTLLLLLGYRLRDLEFRIMLRFLHRYLETSIFEKSTIHLCVQLSDDLKDTTDRSKQLETMRREFQEKDCARMYINVYWGTSRQFLSELRRRWQEFSND